MVKNSAGLTEVSNMQQQSTSGACCGQRQSVLELLKDKNKTKLKHNLQQMSTEVINYST